jgi:hypothetical protein
MKSFQTLHRDLNRQQVSLITCPDIVVGTSVHRFQSPPPPHLLLPLATRQQLSACGLETRAYDRRLKERSKRRKHSSHYSHGECFQESGVLHWTRWLVRTESVKSGSLRRDGHCISWHIQTKDRGGKKCNSSALRSDISLPICDL